MKLVKAKHRSEVVPHDLPDVILEEITESDEQRFFAIISTIANIGSQALAVAAYSGAYAIVLSILVGTAVSLVVFAR